jgi:GT2 family glycosyltransferase
VAGLSVVVPAYAEAAVVERSIGSLERAAELVGGTVEIILVLNRALEDIHVGSRTRILSNERNLGFAGGVMRGVRAAEGEWIAVVNDDCVVEPHALKALLDAGRADPRVGSVAGLVLFADRPQVVNAAGIVVDELGVASERLVGEPLVTAGPRADVFGGSGAFTLYRRAMLDDVGGFDESFLAYLEDADLAWRAQMAGWRCVFEPAARAYHAHSSVLGHGSRSKHFLVGRNRVRMLAKNASTAHLRRHAPAIAFYDLAYVAYAAVRYGALSPLAGRLVGLTEWRRYRRLGAARRAPIALAKPRGVLAALRRDRAYRA